MLENLDWTSSFITVIAALFTTSCLFPDAAPPEDSNSLDASAIARLISCVCELPPLPPLPEVNCLRTWTYDDSWPGSDLRGIPSPVVRLRYQSTQHSNYLLIPLHRPYGERVEYSPHRWVARARPVGWRYDGLIYESGSAPCSA